MVFPWFSPWVLAMVPGEVTQEWRELRLAKQTEASLPGASEGTGQSVVKAADSAEDISLSITHDGSMVQKDANIGNILMGYRLTLGVY